MVTIHLCIQEHRVFCTVSMYNRDTFTYHHFAVCPSAFKGSAMMRGVSDVKVVWIEVFGGIVDELGRAMLKDQHRRPVIP